MMRSRGQTGYMDMQFTPTIIGVVVLIFTLSLIGDPTIDVHTIPFRFYGFLLLGCAMMLFGFSMHLDALGYPESPFNKHSSPVFMTLLCAGPFTYGAYRFYRAGMYAGLILLCVLIVVVFALSIGFALRRSRTETEGRE